MWICQSCFAEGLTGDECPYCGASQELEVGNRLAAAEDKVEAVVWVSDHVQELKLEDRTLRFGASKEVHLLRPGMMLHKRYTIHRALGQRGEWWLYQVIDQLSAESWLLKTGAWRPELEQLAESNHSGLIGSIILSRDPAYILIPPRKRVHRPQWDQVTTAQKLDIISELLELLASAHLLGLANFQLMPAASWVEKIELRLDDALSSADAEGVHKDLQRIALLMLEMFCDQKQDELPADLTPLQPRAALWLRKIWHSVLSTPREALQAFKALFSSGKTSYEPHVEARLVLLSSESLLCDGALLEQGGGVSLQRGAARAGYSLRQGAILLESSAVLLTEAGIMAPEKTLLSELLLAGMVRLDRDVIKRLRGVAAHTLEEEISCIQVALWFGDSEQVSVRLKRALSSAQTAKEWLSLAELLSTFLNDTEAAEEAFRLAVSMAKELSEFFEIAAWLRWRKDDVSGARKLLRPLKKHLTTAAHWLRWAEMERALFDVEPEASIELAIRASEAAAVDNVVELILIGHEHLGSRPEWRFWLEELWKKTDVNTELLQILSALNDVGAGEAYREKEQTLQSLVLELVEEARLFSLDTEGYSILNIDQLKRQIHVQKERTELAHQLQHKITELGNELVLTAPFSLRDLQELQLTLQQELERVEEQRRTSKDEEIEIREMESSEESSQEREIEEVRGPSLVSEYQDEQAEEREQHQEVAEEGEAKEEREEQEEGAVEDISSELLSAEMSEAPQPKKNNSVVLWAVVALFLLILLGWLWP